MPRATYRLQLNRDFTLKQAAETCDYLRELGISDCYLSPVFRAGPGSTHGYDVCAFNEVSPILGGEREFDDLASTVNRFGMGILLDIVPNHMGAAPGNSWWTDVLEKGPGSVYANFFDIDWQREGLQGKVLIPTLEAHYANVLEAGKLKVIFDHEGLAVMYRDKRFPLSPSSYPAILAQVAEVSPQAAAGAPRNLFEQFRACEGSEPAPHDTFAPAKRQLVAWHNESTEFRQALTAVLARLNGIPHDARSFDLLHALLERQHFRLAFWHVGPEELNYRRFFDVTELVSLRMESPEVFQAAHELVLRWLAEGKITGLRVDHPDGLWDPRQYFARLQKAVLTRNRSGTPIFIVCEKILVGDEQLPRDWPVDGTTGYDFLNRVNALFVDNANRTVFDVLYGDFTGVRTPLGSVVNSSKRRILFSALRSELMALIRRLKQISRSTRYGQDFTEQQLKDAVAEIIAAFPVYRTYVSETTSDPADAEKQQVSSAVCHARERDRKLDPAVLEFVQEVLLLRTPADLDAMGKARCREFVMRFQQLCGPVMAKGLEDTAFYSYNRLLSLNEVGGAPDIFGTDIRPFHAYNSERLNHWPHSLLATATHDTKRGEDLRARINVLSEMPDEWRLALMRWSRLNADKKTLVGRQPAPHSNDEYLLYQTLIGAWDHHAETHLEDFRERISAYLLKAIKEAKAHTTWTDPNPAYEEATRNFVRKLLDPDCSQAFLEDFRNFQQKPAFFGRFNSLSQVLLKMTAPGVPDFYQGTELWDLNLVDPDNRKPVDYCLRRALLRELKESPIAQPGTAARVATRLLADTNRGKAKLYLIWRTLEFRNQHRELFESGSYVPVYATGPKMDYVCAFARRAHGNEALVVVPRLVAGLAGRAAHAPLDEEIWLDTLLQIPDVEPGERYRNVLTGELLSISAAQAGLLLAEVLAIFPVALLERVGLQTLSAS